MWRYRRDYAGAGPIRDSSAPSHWGVALGVSRVLNAIFALLYAVLATRLILDFLEARKDSGFYQLVRTVSGPVYAPFKDIVSSGIIANHPVVWSLVVAMFAYALAHAVLNGLLRLATRDRR
jgi:uncharacterized protein YggT (Ycf19 family)